MRGSVVPMTMLFQAMRPRIGDVLSAASVGAGTILIAVVALANLEETFGRDLDYFER